MERKLRKLIAERQLDRIDIIVSTHSIYARAIPAPHSPVVRQRLAELDGPFDDVRRDACYEKPVAVGDGKTIDEAVADLTAKLT